MYQVSHFEIPTDDMGRTQKFYAELFGWKMKKFAEFDYWLIEAGPDYEKGVNICGGMMQKQSPQNGTSQVMFLTLGNTVSDEVIDIIAKNYF